MNINVLKSPEVESFLDIHKKKKKVTLKLCNNLKLFACFCIKDILKINPCALLGMYFFV